MIMLIDDDKDDCDIFRDAANQVSECKCHCVHSPVDALTILDRSEKLPICIFLDLNMPVMDGFAVLKHIKNDPRLSNIPIVVYSTTPNPKEAERSIRLGADRFIRKTSDYKKLINSLKEVKSALIDNTPGESTLE
jgi:CheY-like chemotaxis protein